MKRFFTFLVTSALIAAFCIAGFAESINSARAVACPGCDRGGLVTVKCGERSEVKYERCSHGKIGADHPRRGLCQHRHALDLLCVLFEGF